MNMLKRINQSLSMMLLMCPGIIRMGGASSNKLPAFTYTGTYTQLDDGNGNRRIKFLTSGTFTPQKDVTLDLFIVGGGAAGGTSWDAVIGGVGGGGGGYTNTILSVVAQAGIGYPIVVAAASTGDGNTSSAFNYSALGGQRPVTTPETGYIYHGGNGGSGGGGCGNSTNPAGAGGTNGGNGGNGQSVGGVGQGTTTREFGEATGDLYSGGGAGGGESAAVASGGAGGGGTGGNSYTSPTDGIANTGGGGGGTYSARSLTSASGASGIVVIRNHRTAA